jgi:hypothetical protein
VSAERAETTYPSVAGCLMNRRLDAKLEETAADSRHTQPNHPSGMKRPTMWINAVRGERAQANFGNAERTMGLRGMIAAYRLTCLRIRPSRKSTRRAVIVAAHRTLLGRGTEARRTCDQ